ncbi:unnamed protein product, partial [Mesorhabditis spiculigera]
MPPSPEPPRADSVAWKKRRMDRSIGHLTFLTSIARLSVNDEVGPIRASRPPTGANVEPVIRPPTPMPPGCGQANTYVVSIPHPQKKDEYDHAMTTEEKAGPSGQK